MTHQKPTQEELAAGAQAAIDKVEELDKNPETPEEEPTDPAEETPKETPIEEEPDETETPDEEPKDKEEPTKPKDEENPTDEEPAEKPEDDHKKKFAESRREAMVLHAKNKKTQEALAASRSLELPTDEDMKVEYGTDWEEMSAIEQRLARNDLHSRRKFEIIDEASRAGEDIDQWNTQVDTFLDDPKTLIDNPELEGKVDEFKVFSMKPTRRGLDFEDLVLAFNGESAKNKPAPKKGKMFETGTGGPIDVPKADDGKMSLADGAKLRDTDFNKYKQLLKEGKIAYE